MTLQPFFLERCKSQNWTNNNKKLAYMNYNLCLGNMNVVHMQMVWNIWTTIIIYTNKSQFVQHHFVHFLLLIKSGSKSGVNCSGKEFQAGGCWHLILSVEGVEWNNFLLFSYKIQTFIFSASVETNVLKISSLHWSVNISVSSIALLKIIIIIIIIVFS